jgi:hypothetical protein
MNSRQVFFIKLNVRKFNMAIKHYGRECISSFYTLLKFAYRQTNPIHVHFISSVSASAALGPKIEERRLPFRLLFCYAHGICAIKVCL